MYPTTTPYYQSTNNNYQRPLGLKGRPVSSIEEVRASGIDFDGSVFFFPDLANKKIYTKQIGFDGTAILNMYELKELPVFNTESGNYITRDEFNAALEALRKQLSSTPTEVPQNVEASNSQPTNYTF